MVYSDCENVEHNTVRSTGEAKTLKLWLSYRRCMEWHCALWCYSATVLRLEKETEAQNMLIVNVTRGF